MSVLEALIGQDLDGKYHIEKKLGQGGMGAVYKALHLGTKRTVALKIISPDFMTNQEFVERFKREAEAAGRLRHPNVVNVTDFGFADVDNQRLAYLVMEFLDGCSLGDQLKTSGQLPLALTVDILTQVCLALDCAHKQGIIHRDIKPDNIWLEPNGRGGYNIKVLDFGLAKLGVGQNHQPHTPNLTHLPEVEASNTLINNEVSTLIVGTEAHKTNKQEARITQGVDADTARNAGLTRAGSILGTPLYMSPEQCLGGQLDERSDIYSLGVVVYQMLSGTTPFTGNLNQILLGHVQSKPQTLCSIDPNIPQKVSELIDSALAKDPNDRPPHALAFSTAMQANACGESALLRQAIGLYSDHFYTFTKFALTAYAPIVLAIAILLLVLLTPSLHRPLPIAAALIFFLLAQLFNNCVTTVYTIPFVAGLIQSPLYTLDSRPLLTILRLGMPAFLKSSVGAQAPVMVYASIPYIALMLLPFGSDRWLFWLLVLGLLLLAALLLRHEFMQGKWLYAPITFWEGLSGKDAFERSRTLVSRIRGSIGRIFPAFVFAIMAAAILTIMLLKSLIANLYLANPPSPMQWVYDITASLIGILLSFTLCAVLSPILAIGFSMFYLNARAAGGEELSPKSITQ